GEQCRGCHGLPCTVVGVVFSHARCVPKCPAMTPARMARTTTPAAAQRSRERRRERRRVSVIHQKWREVAPAVHVTGGRGRESRSAHLPRYGGGGRLTKHRDGTCALARRATRPERGPPRIRRAPPRRSLPTSAAHRHVSTCRAWPRHQHRR